MFIVICSAYDLHLFLAFAARSANAGQKHTEYQHTFAARLGLGQAGKNAAFCFMPVKHPSALIRRNQLKSNATHAAAVMM